ncbi:disease resistance protein [Striga asiatica]|uniref:Disease resistance protein n=1 Tax=Striga asiatica TaxID=4170 RepID=A0A5A7NXY7_STRAF|nr:disease resistance protein [Striga asiatica]
MALEYCHLSTFNMQNNCIFGICTNDNGKLVNSGRRIKLLYSNWKYNNNSATWDENELVGFTIRTSLVSMQVYSTPVSVPPSQYNPLDEPRPLGLRSETTDS